MTPAATGIIERSIGWKANEKQVGDLPDDFQGIRNAPGPERIPDAVDLTAQRADDHGVTALPVTMPGWAGGWINGGIVP